MILVYIVHRPFHFFVGIGYMTHFPSFELMSVRLQVTAAAGIGKMNQK